MRLTAGLIAITLLAPFVSAGSPDSHLRLRKHHRSVSLAPRVSNRRCQQSKSSTFKASSISDPGSSSGCFPSAGFQMPASPPGSLDGWWCDPSTEYAFMGFSYNVDTCQSLDQLKREFKDMRQRFKARYVRIYGACENPGREQSIYNDIIEAAWSAGVGVHALVWFGFNGDNSYKKRWNWLSAALLNNPKAKFVIRGVQMGSEPLFDSVLSPSQLAGLVRDAQGKLKPVNIPVTISEMAYGYQVHMGDGAMDVLNAIDFVDIHTLPFFDTKASGGKDAWPIVQGDINWFFTLIGKKKLYLSQNGWPDHQSSGVSRNNNFAVASSSDSKDYFDMLDSHCPDFKSFPNGGVGWFAHLYAEYEGGQGYGVVADESGTTKFPFAPRTAC